MFLLCRVKLMTLRKALHAVLLIALVFGQALATVGAPLSPNSTSHVHSSHMQGDLSVAMDASHNNTAHREHTTPSTQTDMADCCVDDCCSQDCDHHCGHCVPFAFSPIALSMPYSAGVFTLQPLRHRPIASISPLFRPPISV